MQIIDVIAEEKILVNELLQEIECGNLEPNRYAIASLLHAFAYSSPPFEIKFSSHISLSPPPIPYALLKKQSPISTPSRKPNDKVNHLTHSLEVLADLNIDYAFILLLLASLSNSFLFPPQPCLDTETSRLSHCFFCFSGRVPKREGLNPKDFI